MSDSIPYTAIIGRVKDDIDYIAEQAYVKGYNRGMKEVMMMTEAELREFTIFKFSNRKRIVNKYKEWLKYRPVRDCSESFLAWLDMKNYLNLDKIMKDLKLEDEIEPLE